MENDSAALHRLMNSLSIIELFYGQERVSGSLNSEIEYNAIHSSLVVGSTLFQFGHSSFRS